MTSIRDVNDIYGSGITGHQPEFSQRAKEQREPANELMLA